MFICTFSRGQGFSQCWCGNGVVGEALWLAIMDFIAFNELGSTHRTDEAGGGRWHWPQDHCNRVCCHSQEPQPFSRTGFIPGWPSLLIYQSPWHQNPKSWWQKPIVFTEKNKEQINVFDYGNHKNEWGWEATDPPICRYSGFHMRRTKEPVYRRCKRKVQLSQGWGTLRQWILEVTASNLIPAIVSRTQFYCLVLLQKCLMWGPTKGSDNLR